MSWIWPRCKAHCALYHLRQRTPKVASAPGSCSLPHPLPSAQTSQSVSVAYTTTGSLPSLLSRKKPRHQLLTSGGPENGLAEKAPGPSASGERGEDTARWPFASGNSSLVGESQRVISPAPAVLPRELLGTRSATAARAGQAPRPLNEDALVTLLPRVRPRGLLPAGVKRASCPRELRRAQVSGARCPVPSGREH